MEKALAAAKQLSEDPGKNWLPLLKENNLSLVFNPIWRMDLTAEQMNLVVAFIIYSYHPDSPKLDIRKERLENKIRIAESIELDIKNELVSEILHNSNDVANDVVLNFLIDLTDWRWQTVMTQLDFHSNIMRFVGQKTDIEKISEKTDKEGQSTTTIQEFDIAKMSEINKKKGELLKMAIESRQEAEALLAQIKKDYMNTDAAVQADLSFSFTDTAKKKVSIESWREFIKARPR